MNTQQYDAEWEVKPGPGGWEIGYFVCSRCGHKDGENKEICPECKAKMKKIKWS